MIIKIQVSKTLQAKIQKGHPWVFDYQILGQTPEEGRPGDLGIIYTSKNKFLAIGFYDPFSDIRLRILQWGTPLNIDAGFFKDRLQTAVALRRPLEKKGTSGYRVINGENDGFPGMVLDRYEDTAVLKLYTAAWVPYLDEFLGALADTLPVKRCVLRLSRNCRSTVEEISSFKEGQVLFGPALDFDVCFRENGLFFEVDVLAGQKTGFFLDQRENRQRIRSLAKDKSVLNVFSYTGGFSVYAFAGKCKSVWEIDSSLSALKTSRENFELNFPGTESKEKDFQQIEGDAFNALRQLRDRKNSFDIVILDPPAFAVKKKQKPKALATYRRLAESGARLTRPGGLLFSASCSRQISAEEFFFEVTSGIRSAGKNYQEINRTGHAMDHPVSFKGAEYLKGIYLKILEGRKETH
jgi:23S rRNA (cytosine1962-C5)-methyltransferase